MSYIRCLSNPEGLYIWGEAKNRLAITVAGHSLITYCKTSDFDRMLRAYNETGEFITTPTVSAKEIRVWRDTGKICKTTTDVYLRGISRALKTNRYRAVDWKIQVRVGKRIFVMWETTFAYIARNVTPKKSRKKSRGKR